MLSLIDKYIREWAVDLQLPKRVVTGGPDRLYFVYHSEYNYTSLPKTYKDLIFRDPVTIYWIKNIKTFFDQEKSEITFIINHEVVLRRTYFDFLLNEILINILIKLKTVYDIESYLKVLGPRSTDPRFKNMWLAMSKGRHYHPKYMTPKSRELIHNFTNELSLLGLRHTQICDSNGNTRIKIYRDNYSSYSYATIEISGITFDIFHTGIYSGNLYDEPYHGLDLIDPFGVIYRYNEQRITARLKVLAERFSGSK